MATYTVETTIQPGIPYEVDQAEYERLLALGLLVDAPVQNAHPLADQTVAALIDDGTSQTHAAVAAVAIAAGSPVSSVNTKTGAVVLSAADVGADAAGAAAAAQAFAVQRANHTGTQTSATISDLTEAVQDTVAAMIVAGTSVTTSYNDAAGQLTINSTASGGVPTTRQVASGTGLSGGGDLSADRTLAVVYGSTAGTAVQGNDARVTADQAAGTASIRSLGTGAQQAKPGNWTPGIADLPAGATLTVRQNSGDSSWPARPTTRQDVYVDWRFSVAGSAAPAAATTPGTSTNGTYPGDAIFGA